ncbi:lipid-binding SYLF domain-containing protein [Puniceicoccaceae bacterium K14]|nr:lipid-binding SYLF domain-containing protein [Puniceicoccaceae bacterium K14]
MNRILRIISIALATLLFSHASAETKRETLVNRLVNSEYALEEVMSKPETAIPSSVLKDAKGLILTVDYRGGFIIGAHGGFGVLIVKHPLTGEWGVPAFVQTGGANIGLQLGGKEIDTIYVIMDDDTIRKAYTGRFDLSASAAAVAGPVGVVSEANESNDYNNANILVYSTTKGLFAGVSVKAGWVAPQNKVTKKFYDTHYNTPEIVLSDWFEMPQESVSLVQRINYYMNGGH